MILDHFTGDAVALIYGDWDDERGASEDAVTVQCDAGSSIVIRQRAREVVLSAAMARELAKVLVRKARQMEAS